MNNKAFHQISYGLYVVGSRNNDNRLNGQIANTVFQVSNEPATLAISINKQNLTNKYLKAGKLFTISVLLETVPLLLIGLFGFKSGRDVDKFNGIKYQLTENGLPYLQEHIGALLEAQVRQEIDAGTHDIFIGEVITAEVFNETPPMTYAYYQQIKRGKVPSTAPTFMPVEKSAK